MTLLIVCYFSCCRKPGSWQRIAEGITLSGLCGYTAQPHLESRGLASGFPFSSLHLIIIYSLPITRLGLGWVGIARCEIGVWSPALFLNDMGVWMR